MLLYQEEAGGRQNIIAKCGNAYWFIQVKSSAGVPRIRGYEIKRLREIGDMQGGSAYHFYLAALPQWV